MPQPSLSEDDIDDLLYFARTNDTPELSTLLTSLSSQHACSQSDTLLAARDPGSGNTVAHYAAANGFDDQNLPFTLAPQLMQLAHRTDLLKWLLACLNPAHTTKSPTTELQAHADGTSPSSSSTLPSNGPIDTSTDSGTSVKSRYPELFTIPNASGSTPLHYAATTGSLACAQVLVQAGAQIGVRNAMGRTPVYEAEAGGKEEIVAFLLKEGGDAVVEGGRTEEKEEDGDGDTMEEVAKNGQESLNEEKEGLELGGKEEG
ncbi:MAG: hypothetical protein Q9165_005695 [Trypethelium subeluteriae]